MAHYTYSIIFPIYNEESCLEEVLTRTINTLSASHEPFEIICVDDCSTDGTWSIIQRVHERYPQVIKGIQFLRNFGHQLGVFAGIKHSQGEYIAVLDADGQDPPEILPAM